MKIITQITLFILTIALMAACTQAPEGEKAEVGQAQEVAKSSGGTTYGVDTVASKLAWKAVKVNGGHNGTINIKGGTLTTQDGNITNGSFELDLNTITVLDLEGEWKQKLEKHLKTGDFFETEKFPTGRFEIVSVEPIAGKAGVTHRITGNLTMKNITKSVAFDALVEVTDDKITASTPAFTIDRTDWDIKYNSKFLLSAAEVKEKLIDHAVTLEITLVANK